MLASAQRLRRRDDFASAIRHGRRAGRGGIVVHMLSTPGFVASPERYPPTRAGFIVAKAVGSAVVRNRVRRRLRHLVRCRLTTLPPGTDLVVRALPLAASRRSAELAEDLDAAVDAALCARPGRARASGAVAERANSGRGRGGRREERR